MNDGQSKYDWRETTKPGEQNCTPLDPAFCEVVAGKKGLTRSDREG